MTTYSSEEISSTGKSSGRGKAQKICKRKLKGLSSWKNHLESFSGGLKGRRGEKAKRRKKVSSYSEEKINLHRYAKRCAFEKGFAGGEQIAERFLRVSLSKYQSSV
jgi:hypothetical protein